MPETRGQAAPSQKLLFSKAVFAAVLQYSHRKIEEKRCLRVKRMSQQLTISVYIPRMVWPPCTEEKPGRGITAVTDKKIRRRN